MAEQSKVEQILEPRRIPADTTEITYTGRNGAQESIPLERRGGYAFAQPRNLADAAHLDGLGMTTVARKATTEATPAAGESKEG